MTHWPDFLATVSVLGADSQKAVRPSRRKPLVMEGFEAWAATSGGIETEPRWRRLRRTDRAGPTDAVPHGGPAMSLSYDAHPSLGRALFGTAELGDRRRTARLVHTFDRMCAHPGGTLPDKLASPPDPRGLYRLCDADEVTHEAVLAPARAYTQARVESHTGDVLVLHDATELDYTTLSSLADDLGQIGKGDHRGYLCHDVLAVEPDSGEVLGLMDQILHRRDEVPEDETLAEHRDRPTRESRLWVTGTRHLPDDRRLIDVADQGADTFEFLEHEFKSGRRFVIRAAKPREVYAGHEPVGPRRELKAYARDLPELGRFTMDVQAQPGRKAQGARVRSSWCAPRRCWWARRTPRRGTTAVTRCRCTWCRSPRSRRRKARRRSNGRC
jgi:hypothetical protein